MDPLELVVPVAIPRPLDQYFSYRAPIASREQLQPGTWVRVPFGPREVLGFVAEAPKLRTEITGELPALKAVTEIGDADSRISPEIWALCNWAQKYYFAPLGELLQSAVPAATLGMKSARREAKPLLRKQALVRQVSLTKDQSAVVERLDELRRAEKPELNSRVALLHGVTGSGKTEVYIELARRTLAEGKGVILLVPEIALTSQLHERLETGIGESVAQWHSAIPDAQRRDESAALRSGEFRAVVGARSAIFAPVKNLGLIIIDEEHDPTYKQEDRVKYHARDLAVVRSKMANALTILGSATPSLETLERVREGKYHLLELRERIAAGGMPTIRLIDLTIEERVEEAQAPLARVTLEAIRETIARDEQVMIFLNRRGFANFLLCDECKWVAECPNCSISLTVHKKSRQLRCHVCAHLERIPDDCQKCQGLKLVPVGAGTESLEEQIPELIPEAKILRLDRDIITSATRLEKTLRAFRDGEAQILLGTQMLVKGHDFPKVTLVVVILADALFRYPDFRAPERALQVLTQVSGRAGRSDLKGQVFIQTYQPEHPVLAVVSGQLPADEFLASERSMREELFYPPFGRLARIRIESSDNAEARERATQLAKAVTDDAGVDVLGPSEAFLEKAKGIYRWEFLLRSKNVQPLQTQVQQVRKFAFRQRWPLLVDIDPYGVG